MFTIYSAFIQTIRFVVKLKKKLDKHFDETFTCF